MDFLPAVFRPGRREKTHTVEDGLSDSTLQQSHATLQPPTIAPQSRRGTIVQLDPTNHLAMFRHLVGIHSTKSFGSENNPTNLAQHNSLHFDGRAAPNIGIYNRVCHREASAKRGYKIASVLINGCLGVQVIVAAALTAMGAANSSHVSITAFGAINTVIAGILTYLKGSGLPNRIRYYENEWKRCREYIEQRERDFSRPDCTLDVYEVTRAIEQMYEEIKADIQANTPDNFVSVGDMRARKSPLNPQAPNLSELTSHANKFQQLELKYGRRVTDLLEGVVQKEEERLRTLENGLIKDKASEVANLGREYEKGFEKEARGRVSEISDYGRSFEKDIEARKSRVESRLAGAGQDFERGMDLRASRLTELGRDMEARGSRLVDIGRDVEREGERHVGNVASIGRAVDDEIHSITPRKEQG